ncbi:MAG: acyl-CoA dehydrogenase [Gemmatimonadales bacterium]|nr:acyl-CoA dehydrogenase [Gemmatimonadales bacterium]NIN13361.1 acyl-CoA dehydrogenase [Gemmatimonadales bacterium]NIN51364.1 acyl-CoA dehydrogenase [Gemmatimonadales bacterium]NIP08828.1 acyl-CoA dehydrogenase [Gemmatimonadales bacterium]NIQ99822.1 acyl-CoA dehydrogenase [Gemmatimonadales bacterium]
MSTAATEKQRSAEGAGGHVSEREARKVAEAAREKEWKAPSFLKELFNGRVQLALIHPFPEVPQEELERATPWLEKLDKFLKENVDAEAIDRDYKIPEKIVKGLAELGCMGIKIPQEYGGLGFSQTIYNRAIALAASYEGSIAVLLSAHQSIGVPQPLKLFGTPEQKKKYFPRFAKGEISAFALTEPDVGSDPARMQTSATPTEDGEAYLLNGDKLWCTNGTIADIIVVMARTPDNRITAFIVESDWPGVEVVHRCHFMGLHGIENGLLRFTNVRVPKENMLWDQGKGLKLALITLNTGRLTIPATCSVAAKACVGIARRFSQERVQWGRPIGKHDAVAQMLGRMAATAFAMEAVSELSALMSDQARFDIRLEAAMAKLWNTERGWEIIDDTLQIRSGRGYESATSLKARGDRPEPVERMMRDFRINMIFEGSSEIMRLFIAREVVDTHLRVAGAIADPEATFGAKLAAFIKAGFYYAAWYPARWLGWGRWPRYGEFGPLAKHLRYVNRASRRLARKLFYAIVRFGPKLEKRQAILFRFVEIGAELFAMCAACTRAQALRNSKSPEDRAQADMATHLADTFCRVGRRRIEDRFGRVFRNDDVTVYHTAQRVMANEALWMEEGIPVPE